MPVSVVPARSTRVLALVSLLSMHLAACAAIGRPMDADGGADASDGSQQPDSSTSDGGTDATIDAGPRVATCESCVIDEQCPQGENGTTPHICATLSGTSLCLPRCSDTGAGCPIGFTCIAQVGTSASYCIPQAAGCCLDQDGDGYGTGATCLGPDCNDNSSNVNPGESELCNAVDDDCNTLVDDQPIDCPVADCEGTGTGAFVSHPSSACMDGQCAATQAMACGQYACAGGGTEGTVCATTCIAQSMENDTYCATFAHCTQTDTCEMDLADGSACVEDSDCSSNHCDNGFCCTGNGNCCAQGSDCPGFPGAGSVCEDAVGCQGTYGTVSCSNFVCVTANGQPNDSACDATTLANGCGLFQDVYCTGGTNQTMPSCLTTCVSSAQCDTGAFCNAAGQCELPRGDGQACTAGLQCQSGHCQNGYCCGTGDCCSQASNCPGSYSSNPVCDMQSSCQGTRNSATCINSTCGSQILGDDSACVGVANTCALYPSVSCTGASNQTAPACATACTSDSECDTNAHCDPGVGGLEACVPDVANGTACDEDSDCTSSHCQNGFCCAGGDCCQNASQCPSATYAIAPFCLNPTQCQGRRYDPVCNSNTCQVGNVAVEDDSGCVGITANTCSAYKDVVCTSAVTQPTAMCASSCSSAADCDQPGAFCNASNQCQSLGGQGASCSSASECSGLPCVDGRCCNSNCSGACEACNVPGSLGTCTAIPANTDPSNECGQVSCSGYYGGWNGNNCQQRANAPDTAVACNGNRACQGAADVCPAQPAVVGALTCNATCQTPSNGTCSGTLAGACNNTNNATQTCGTGPCQVTVPQCSNGAPFTCVPGAPSNETCNTVDDNCDGAIDNNIASSVDGYEPNDACDSNSTYLGNHGRGGESIVTATVYGPGDVDYYRVYQTAGGCTGSTAYRGWMNAELTVPVGAGTYQVCLDTDCTPEGATCYNVAAGTTFSTPSYQRNCGGCGGTIGSTTYIRVRGIESGSSQGWQCLPYTLKVNTWRSGHLWC